MKARLLLFSLFLTTTLLHAMEPATIHEAAITGNLPAVQRFLDQDSSSVNHRDKDGNTPLNLAIQNFTEIKIRAKRYIRPGAPQRDIESVNREKARCEEIFQKHVAVVRALLDHGARVNEQNNLGYTPLHAAASNCSEFFVWLLIKHGASVNLRTNKGDTPADLAASCFWYPEGYVANVLRHYAARLAFCEVLHSRLGAESQANIFPQYVVQEILQHLRPEDFAIINLQRHKKEVR